MPFDSKLSSLSIWGKVIIYLVLFSISKKIKFYLVFAFVSFFLAKLHLTLELTQGIFNNKNFGY